MKKGWRFRAASCNCCARPRVDHSPDRYRRAVVWFEVLSHRVEIEDVEGLSILSLPRYTRHGRVARGSKRLVDLIGATAATIALSPILLMTIILIKLDSKGPVFYKHRPPFGRSMLHGDQ